MNENTLNSLGYPQIQKMLQTAPCLIWANVMREN